MKLHKYLFIAAGMALAAGFTACDEGGLDYEYVPAPTPTGAQVYFDSADNGMTVSLADGQTTIEVPIFRVNADADLSVNLTLTDESGLLSLPNGGVTFAAGQKEAKVNLTLNFNGVTANQKYPFSLTVPAADASEYAVASLDAFFEFSPWTEWTKLGTGTYEYAQYWTGDDPGLDIMWRQSLVDPSMVEFQILHVMYDVTMSFSGVKRTAADGAELYVLSVPEQPTGLINSNYNEMVMVADMYNYSGNAQYQNLSLYDPESGTFQFALVYYISLGVFGNGYEYFQLDGFATYDIDLNEAGHYVEPNGTDHALVQCHLSDGLVSAQYTAVDGELTDAQVDQVVEGILSGAIESKTTEESNGYLTFTFPEAGTYTVVAVGFNDAGEQACVSTLVLNYVPAGSAAPGAPDVDEDPDWTTLGYCTYTDDFLPALTSEIGPETFEVKIQISNNEETGADFRLVNTYGPDGWGLPFVDPSQNYFMNIVVVDEANHVVLMTDDQGVQPFQGYGNMYTSSMAIQQIAGGANLADVIASGICGTFEDGFIHFPENQLMIGLEKADGSVGGWKANTTGAFEIDMSSLISEQRTYRTALRRPVRVYGNPLTTMKVEKRSFLSNVTTEQIMKHRTTTLSKTPIR